MCRKCDRLISIIRKTREKYREVGHNSVKGANFSTKKPTISVKCPQTIYMDK